MLTPDLRDLVDEAAAHAGLWHDGDDHTVAAAVRTVSGTTVLGLNAHHFLGGPCGEVSALANHAATRPDDPICAVAAVHGPTAEVIAPCGKCRQILHDLDPAIRCVVRTPAGLEARTVKELLPFAFLPHVADQPQRLYMWEGYEAAIRSGAKRRTIRVDDPFRPGPAQLVFDKHDGATVTLPTEITSVRTTRRDELTGDDAVADGFEDLAQLQTALDTHYPGLSADAPVDVVNFALPDDD